MHWSLSSFHKRDKVRVSGTDWLDRYLPVLIQFKRIRQSSCNRWLLTCILFSEIMVNWLQRVMSGWGSDLWDRGEVGFSFIAIGGRKSTLLNFAGGDNADTCRGWWAWNSTAKVFACGFSRISISHLFAKILWFQWWPMTPPEPHSWWFSGVLIKSWHLVMCLSCRYLKDRGEVEREYAKALRKLVAKYQVKEGKREGSAETTQVLISWMMSCGFVTPLNPQSQGFKSVLRELGFQVNRHLTCTLS